MADLPSLATQIAPRGVHSASPFGTDAQRLLAEILVSIENGVYVKPRRLTAGEYLEQWLQGYVTNNNAHRTREEYEEIVRLHLGPALSSLQLLDLQPQHIQEYYARALASGRRDGKGGL